MRAGTNCGKDFRCLQNSLISCDTNQIKYYVDETIDNFEIKGVLEISTYKFGNNLCDIGIGFSEIKSNFDQETTQNYKNSKLTDLEINRIADGQRRNKQIDKDSYKKCVLKLDTIHKSFKQINDILEIRLTSNCSDMITVKTDEVNAIIDTIPELNVSGKSKEKDNLLIQNNAESTQHLNTEKKETESISEKKKKTIDAINSAIMGPKPSKVYEEKRKKGMTNDQIGQEALDSFFAHLKKCDEVKCEGGKCENCSKGNLFCSKNNRCTECNNETSNDCKSGFLCMFGICKKKMTKEEFLNLK